MTVIDKKFARSMRRVKKAMDKIRRKIRRRIRMAKRGPVPRVFTSGSRTR